MKLPCKIKIDEETYKKASELKQSIIIRKGLYFLKTGCTQKCTLEECDKYFNTNKSSSTEEIEKIYNGLRIITRKGNLFQCSCAVGFKKGSCHHSEAVKMKLEICKDLTF